MLHPCADVGVLANINGGAESSVRHSLADAKWEHSPSKTSPLVKNHFQHTYEKHSALRSPAVAVFSPALHAQDLKSEMTAMAKAWQEANNRGNVASLQTKYNLYASELRHFQPLHRHF